MGMAEFEKRFNLTVWEGYGAVDGGGFSLFNAGTSPKGSMGKAPPEIQAKVVDDNGAECAVGEAGNLIFKIDDPMRAGRVFQEPRRHRRQNPRWMAVHRRHGVLRRRGQLFRRSQNRLDAPARQKYLILQSQEDRQPASRGAQWAPLACRPSWARMT